MEEIISQTPVENDLIEVSHENDFSKAISELFQGENLTKKTELKRNEVNKIALLYAIAKKYNFKELMIIIETFLELRISIDRKGRKELVDIAKSIIADMKKTEELKKEADKIRRID